MSEHLDEAAASRPDHLAVADPPNREAVTGEEARRLSWAQLRTAVQHTAAGLSAAGVKAGDHVAIQLANVVDLPIALLACGWIGAVSVPFPIQHRRHELQHGFELLSFAAVITADRPDRDDQIASITELAASYPLPDGTSPPVLLPSALEATEAMLDRQPFSATDTATVCWTSGTTGMPKGVPRDSRMWMATSSHQVNELGITGDDRILCPFPLVNMAGIGGMFFPWLESQSTLCLHQPLDLPTFLGQIGGESITYTVAPPPLLNMLLHNKAMLESIDLSNVRVITSGSAPLDPWMVEGWEAMGIEICNAFGSNEGIGMLSTRRSVPSPTNRARLFPLPSQNGMSARLADITTGDTITEPGIIGELRFSGPTVFNGYVDSDGSEFDAQGSLRTGDLFEYADTEDGRLLRFVDRAKDIVIRGGMNVSAAEVETLISSTQGVAECAVVGYPDADLGERVGVFVVAASEADVSLDDVVAHMRSQDVASYKLPERIEMIEALPRNPVGKVVKGDLRELWKKA